MRELGNPGVCETLYSEIETRTLPHKWSVRLLARTLGFHPGERRSILLRITKMKVLCIKDLYKSTYLKLAFHKDREYEVSEEEKDLIFIKDENERPFSFSKTAAETLYDFNKYFIRK